MKKKNFVLLSDFQDILGAHNPDNHWWKEIDLFKVECVVRIMKYPHLNVKVKNI